MKPLIPLLFLLVSACTATAPTHINNICLIFNEKDNWLTDAEHSHQKWGIPVPIIMAIIAQESGFLATAEPDRPWLLGFIPWFRASSAYGYAQAQNATWDEYLENTHNYNADRDDFASACDFVGWYCHQSFRKLGIAKTDAKNLYLAYHEGHLGYKRKTYAKKPKVLHLADKVDKNARLFQMQSLQCQTGGLE